MKIERFLPAIILLIILLLPGCDFIGGVFQTGVGVGVFIAIIIILLILFVGRIGRRR